jgi:hypothetical protein
MVRAQRRFSVNGFLVVGEIVTVGVLAASLPEPWAGIVMLCFVVLFVPLLWFRCTECGKGGLCLTMFRHECEAVRRRTETGEELPPPRRAKWERFVLVAMFLALALIIALCLWTYLNPPG